MNDGDGQGCIFFIEAAFNDLTSRCGSSWRSFNAGLKLPLDHPSAKKPYDHKDAALHTNH